MDLKLNAILEQAAKLFMKYGIKSLTMDDIANELKVSKKTLYLFVTDKQDLVLKTLEKYCNEDKQMVAEIQKQAGNAMEECLMITKHVKQKFASIHPSIHYDLEKYYPEAWQMMNNHQLHFVFDAVKSNLEKGMAEGYYREDLNPEIIARAFVTKVYAMTDRTDPVLQKYDFGTIYAELMRYHLRGIASEKGHKQLNSKLKSFLS
ncbi:MAG TPA: TetR/AcrR family transcriptional regulator [Flavobacteriales bacterium]|nr:TetR/AcrR family transcriptional regulator [Flavobacteriales bacterium]